MASLSIQNAFDITAARNQLRRLIVGSNWPPVFQARAATTVTAFGELIIRARVPSVLNVAVVMGNGLWGIRFECELPGGKQLTADDVS